MKPRVLGLLLALAAAACGSPEASRTRGGGAGADIGNRPKHVEMHRGSNPYWRTPDRIPMDGPSLEPARHAQQFSRP